MAYLILFRTAKFVMGYPCVRPYIFFSNTWSSYFALFLSYVNITKSQNQMAAILKLFAPKS